MEKTGLNPRSRSKPLSMLIISLLLLSTAGTFSLKTCRTQPTQIIVPDQYSTIQAAINAAAPGDTIFVRNGTYYQHVVANKAVSLVGEHYSTTVIDGNLTGSVVWITRDHVNIRGFTIQRSGQAFSDSGIRIYGTQHCDISGNRIVDNEFGVFGSPRNMSITDNTIEENFLGVALDSGATGNVIARNHLVANYVSVHLNLADANHIVQNNMTNNYRSVTLWDSKNNTLYHNNFLNNTLGSINSPNFFDNGFEGNYWSNYTGADSDHDGIGDTPYIIEASNQDNYPLMSPYIPGDYNHNGEVNMVDADMVRDAWMCTEGEPNYNPHVDFNMDGIINIKDATIVGVNWLKHT